MHFLKIRRHFVRLDSSIEQFGAERVPESRPIVQEDVSVSHGLLGSSDHTTSNVVHLDSEKNVDGKPHDWDSAELGRTILNS
jgi:hypothetical protein